VVQLVHDPVDVGTQDHRLYRHPALAVQGGDGGRLDAGGEQDGVVEAVGAHVIGEHHVAAGHQHALGTAQELGDRAVGGGAAAADEQRGGLQDRLADHLQAGLAQGGAGLDHVGDHVGDAEAHGVLHRAVEPDHVRGHVVVGQVPVHDARVGGGDALPGQVVDLDHRAGAGGEAERRAAEVQVEHPLGRRAGVDQQVPAGDAQVQVAGADVGGDVAGAQVEELDVV